MSASYPPIQSAPSLRTHLGAVAHEAGRESGPLAGESPGEQARPGPQSHGHQTACTATTVPLRAAGDVKARRCRPGVQSRPNLVQLFFFSHDSPTSVGASRRHYLCSAASTTRERKRLCAAYRPTRVDFAKQTHQRAAAAAGGSTTTFRPPPLISPPSSECTIPWPAARQALRNRASAG